MGPHTTISLWLQFTEVCTWKIWSKHIGPMDSGLLSPSPLWGYTREMVLAWEAWKIVGFITELAKSWMEVAQDQGISVLAPPSTVPGPDDLVCAGICDIMLRILEEDSSIHTTGSAVKRTSLFGICSLLGDGLLSSGCQCLLLLPDSGETFFPCASLVLILLPASTQGSYPCIFLMLFPMSPQILCPVLPAPSLVL